MKLKSIKIENYKSFAEENNTLILEDLNTIIGKNESGKSNLIECLSGISLSGINDKSFFQKINKNTGKRPIISVILIPTKEEEKKYKIVGETKITLNDQYDIDIEGGFSDLIKNNKIFQENKKSLNELNKNVVDLFYNQDDRKNFNNIIEMINESENKMFFNYNYVKNITEKIYNNSNYSEFSECLKKCILYLEEIKELLPYFIEIKDYSLKSKYTKSYLEDSSKSKEMLKHLLNCMNMKLDDLINPLTEEDRKIINSAKPVVTEECPEVTDAQMKKYKSWYEVHPNGNDMYKVSVKKTAVSLRIDTDVLMALKEMGTGYQTRINNILRKAVFG